VADDSIENLRVSYPGKTLEEIFIKLTHA